MKRGKVSTSSKDYASNREIYEHAYYIISSSRDLLLQHAIDHHHPWAYWASKWALDSYTKNHDSIIWRSVGRFVLHLTKRVSEKVNMHGQNSKVFAERPWGKLISMGLLP
jgi:hypothetical protein